MIHLRISSRDRKTLIGGGIVVLSVLMIARGGPAWLRWRSEVEATTNSALAEASAAARTVGRSRSVDGAIRNAELRKMEVSPAFVNGSGIASAAITLASVVGEAATTNGVRIGSLQASGDSAASQSGGVALVRVRGDAIGRLVEVGHFFAALESGVPLITVRELSVSQAQSSGATGRPDALRVQFVIEALAHFDTVGERQ